VNWPIPQPGMVIRYAYLWEREARSGHDNGQKDRPCAIILTLLEEGKAPYIRVLPITHSMPADPDDALEIPPLTKQRLGLDHERSWIILSEANDFVWPGPDLRPLTTGQPDSVVYGMLPPGLFKILRERLLARWKQKTATAIKRLEPK
jgi:hypothetical protein